MQGRLLPKIDNKYQAHPIGIWEKEFMLAKKIGLNCIEFIIDLEGIEKNPIIANNLSKINSLSKKTNIEVYSICMDFLMEAPIVKYKSSVNYIYKIIENIKNSKIKYLNLPCVDNSKFRNNTDINIFIDEINKFKKILEAHNIKLCIESDLNPTKFKKLNNKINSKYIGINYDTGNSSSIGYKIEDEIKEYKNNIYSIHIKDRKLNGSSVFLGTGNANFKKFFKLININQFNGPIIFQAYRDDEGYTLFKDQFKWFKENFYV